MKLFKIKGRASMRKHNNVFFAFVIAGNDIEAKGIVEEELSGLDDAEILSITEEDTENWSRLLCICTD